MQTEDMAAEVRSPVHSYYAKYYAVDFTDTPTQIIRLSRKSFVSCHTSST